MTTELSFIKGGNSLPVENTNENSNLLCEVCLKNYSKYKCPACNLKSCSVVCVKLHKEQNNCNGLALPYSSASSNKEYNEKSLLKDYLFLEQANKIVESSNRLLCQQAVERTFSYNQRCSTSALKRLCEKRKIKLILAPGELAQRKSNTTSIQKEKIFWRLKWIIPSINYSFFEPRVSEECTLEFLLHRNLKLFVKSKSLKNELKKIFPSGIQDIQLLLPDSGSIRTNFYHHLDIKQKLKAALYDRTIEEHPVFLLVPSYDLSSYNCFSKTDTNSLIQSASS